MYSWERVPQYSSLLSLIISHLHWGYELSAISGKAEIENSPLSRQHIVEITRNYSRLYSCPVVWLLQEQIHPERALKHTRLLHLTGGIEFSVLVSPWTTIQSLCSVVLVIPGKDGNLLQICQFGLLCVFFYNQEESWNEWILHFNPHNASPLVWLFLALSVFFRVGNVR